MTTLRSRNMLVAGALAVAAALLTVLYVTKARGTTQTASAAAPVLVATHDIALGTPGSAVLAQHLAAQKGIPQDAVVPGALVSPKQLAGLVTTQPIYRGEQLTATRFETGSALGLRAQLRGTLRAIQISGDPNQLLAGTLRDGDRVDVVASVTDPTNPTNHLTQIVLRGILVLQAPESKSSWTNPTGSASQSASATLQVTDVQAQKLFLVVKNADWSLMLRPVVAPADDSPSVASTANVMGRG